MTLKGIDISHWQKNIDLSAVNADFVILKATEGIGYTDPSFKSKYNAAKKAEKKLGVYHFARPTAYNDAKKEAEYFYSQVKDCVGEAIFILDWEAENKHNTAWAKTWLDRFYELTGVKPLIYMSESVVNSYDWSAVAKADYGLWVAKYKDYVADYNYDMSDAGTAPKVKYWSFVALWQWTSVGRLDKYNGNLDCNVFYGDGAAWDKYAKKTVSATKPVDTTKPSQTTEKADTGEIKLGSTVYFDGKSCCYLTSNMTGPGSTPSADYYEVTHYNPNSKCPIHIGEKGWVPAANCSLKKETPNTNTTTAKKLHLPKTATRWNVYPTNKAPVVGNECGALNPSLFGGLTYDILATPQTNVVTIQTRDFGKVNIYVAPETGAVIK